MIYKIIFDKENSKVDSKYISAECSTELDFFELEDCNIDKSKLSLLRFDIKEREIPDLIFNDLNLRLISDKLKRVLESKFKCNSIHFFETTLCFNNGVDSICWLMLFTKIYSGNVVDWSESLVSADQLIAPKFKEEIIDKEIFNFEDQFSDIYISEAVKLSLEKEKFTGLEFRE